MRARAIAAPARANIARHLVLAYRPGWISLTDLNDIRRHVTDIDPTIETFIVPSTARNSVTRRRAAARPTLVVSNGWMPDFHPARGKIYQGFPIPKPEELRRLAAAGVPIPRTAILTPDLRLDEAEWGEFVVVKPTDIATSSHGRGFQLMRTRRVRFIPPADYPPGHPGRLGPMMVQKYIDTGDHITHIQGSHPLRRAALLLSSCAYSCRAWTLRRPTTSSKLRRLQLRRPAEREKSSGRMRTHLRSHGPRTLRSPRFP